jgi:alpha-N-acetylglucosamine transferase
MRRTWMALVTQEEYFPGVEVLAKALKVHRSKYPLHILVTDNISPAWCDQMRKLGCTIKQVERLIPPTLTPESYLNPNFAEVWTKLRVWQEVEFDQAVYLDSDMLILQNIDELFDVEAKLASAQACICNPFKVPRVSPFFTPQACPYSEHNLTPELLATGAVDLARLDPRGRYFNAGFFCFRPDKREFDKMMRALETWDDSETAFAEQDFLNVLYAGQWQAVPYIYNTLKTWDHAHPAVFDLTKIKVLHYIRAKPWQNDPTNARYEHLNQLWWTMRNLPEGASFRLPASAIPTQPMGRRPQRPAAATAR